MRDPDYRYSAREEQAELRAYTGMAEAVAEAIAHRWLGTRGGRLEYGMTQHYVELFLRAFEGEVEQWLDDNKGDPSECGDDD